MGWRVPVSTSAFEPQPEGSTVSPPKPLWRDRALAFLRAPYRRLGFAGGVTSVALLGVMWRFSPAEYSYLPACPIHAATGFFCPGCGTARALGSLLQGDLAAALDRNALIVVLLPLFATIGVLQFVSLVRDNQFRELPLPRWILIAMMIAMLAFAVARNLPYEWSRYLAP